MTRPIAPAAAMFKGASGNTLVGDVYGEEGPPVLLLHGGGQTRHAWKKTGELIARMGRVAYAVDQRGHGDSEWVDGRRLPVSTTSPPMRACWPIRWPSAAACGRWRSAPRSAAWRRCWPKASRQRRRGAACFPRWCWSTSRRGSISTASPRSRASCARSSARASARSRRPPTRSPPICRTGRGRARTRA